MKKFFAVLFFIGFGISAFIGLITLAGSDVIRLMVFVWLFSATICLVIGSALLIMNKLTKTNENIEQVYNQLMQTADMKKSLNETNKENEAIEQEDEPEIEEPVTETTAEGLYKRAHNAHYGTYSRKNCELAATLYHRIIKEFPESPECGYSKTQLDNLSKEK